MAPQPEQALAHFRLVEKLGEGGMGVVYRAEDLTLRRPVALKFLTEESFSREDRRARFLREARLAAALNHPNICTVYEVGEVQPGEERKLPSGESLPAHTPYLALEFIDGRSLAREIRTRKAFPLDTLIEIAIHIAEGLSAAHARQIVHRDLKPGNIMLDKDGRAKILDFGLAKPFVPAERGDAALSKTETISAELTREGLVVGTSAYMSPEQTSGEPLDARSDVFSFGILLYEMVAGHRPFRGETASATRLKIAEAEPEPLPEDRVEIPEELKRIIRRCLKKRPDDRYNDTRDLVASLKDLRQETSSGKQRNASSISTAVRPLADRHRDTRWVLLATGTILVVAIITVSLSILLRRNPPPSPPFHQRITHSGAAFKPGISPDGQYVAYVQKAEAPGPKLLVQDLAGGEPLEVFRADQFKDIRWSPDGTELLVSADRGRQEGWGTFLIPRLGGPPRRLPYAPSVAWAPNGTRYAGIWLPDKRVLFHEKSTGESSSIELSGSFTYLMDIDWSPTDNFLTILTLDEEDHYSIWTLSPDGTQQARVLESDSILYSPRWSGDGSSIYYLQARRETSDLWKIRIDARSGKADGDPSAVFTGLETGGAYSHARDGKVLVIAKSMYHSNLWQVILQGDSGGGPVRTGRLTSGTFRDEQPRVSPDGQRLAFVREGDIYTMPVQGGRAQQFTFTESREYHPVWSPDGAWLAFGSDQGGTPKVWRTHARGEKLQAYRNTSLSSDFEMALGPGSRILYHRPDNQNFYLLDPNTEQEFPLVEDDSVGWMFSPEYSPDGTQVAVKWNRKDGYLGVWLISVEDSSERRISKEYVTPIGWSPDGAWVYAWDENSNPPKAVKIPASGGEPETIIEWPFEGKEGYCVPGPDERRWICPVRESSSDIWVVKNFDPEVG